MSGRDPTTRPEARCAHADLAHAVRALNETGRRTPCQRDPEPFTYAPEGSMGYGVRAEAAAACRAACPLVELCHVYAEAAHENAHVWGGVDRTPSTARQQAG